MAIILSMLSVLSIFDSFLFLCCVIYSRLDFKLPPGVELYFGISRKNYTSERPNRCGYSGSTCLDVVNSRCMHDSSYTTDKTLTKVTSPVYMHVNITRAVKVTWCCRQPMSPLTSIHYILCHEPVQGVAAMVSFYFFSILLCVVCTGFTETLET